MVHVCRSREFGVVKSPSSESPPSGRDRRPREATNAKPSRQPPMPRSVTPPANGRRSVPARREWDRSRPRRSRALARALVVRRVAVLAVARRKLTRSLQLGSPYGLPSAVYPGHSHDPVFPCRFASAAAANPCAPVVPPCAPGRAGPRRRGQTLRCGISRAQRPKGY